MTVLIFALFLSYLNPYPIGIMDMNHGDYGTIHVPLDLAPGSWVTLFLMKGDQLIAELSNTIMNYDSYTYQDIIPYTWSSGNDYRVCVINSLNNAYYSDYFTINTSRAASVSIRGEFGLNASHDNMEIRFSGLSADSIIATIVDEEENLIAMGIQATRNGGILFNDMTFYEDMEYNREYHASLFDQYRNFYDSQKVSFQPFIVEVTQTPQENMFTIHWDADNLSILASSPIISVMQNSVEFTLSGENIQYVGDKSAIVTLPEQYINQSRTLRFCVSFESVGYGRIESIKSLAVVKPNDFESSPIQVSLSRMLRSSINYSGDVDFVRIPDIDTITENDVVSIEFHGLVPSEIQAGLDWRVHSESGLTKYTISALEARGSNNLFEITSLTEKDYSINVDHDVDRFGESSLAKQRNWRVDVMGYAIPDIYESGIAFTIGRQIGFAGVNVLAGAMYTSSENSVELFHTSDVSAPLTHIIGGLDYRYRINRFETGFGIQYRQKIDEFEQVFAVDSLANNFFSSGMSANATFGIKLSSSVFTGLNVQYLNFIDSKKEGILCFGVLASLYL